MMSVTNITTFKCADKMSGQQIKCSDIVCYMFMPSGLCLCMHNIVLLYTNGYLTKAIKLFNCVQLVVMLFIITIFIGW